MAPNFTNIRLSLVMDFIPLKWNFSSFGNNIWEFTVSWCLKVLCVWPWLTGDLPLLLSRFTKIQRLGTAVVGDARIMCLESTICRRVTSSSLPFLSFCFHSIKNALISVLLKSAHFANAKTSNIAFLAEFLLVQLKNWNWKYTAEKVYWLLLITMAL